MFFQVLLQVRLLNPLGKNVKMNNKNSMAANVRLIEKEETKSHSNGNIKGAGEFSSGLL